VIFDFWGPKALQKKKIFFLGIGQLLKILSSDNLKTTGAICKMKLTCQLGICTFGNVEFLGLGQPLKFLILEV
jgi:hypothetical protein